jgi:hypothetical protein
LLLITLAWWQQVIGTQAPLLEYPSCPVPHDTPHLLSAHRTFLASINGSLHIANLEGTVPTPLRNDDVCLIDAVLTLDDQKPADVVAFNRVRLHLGVMFLSEIAMADGRSLARDAWDGHRPRSSPYLWPYQPCPGTKSFRSWRRILANLFLSGARKRVSRCTLDLSLRHPVGSWLPNSEPFRLQWEAFFSPIRNALYTANDDGTCHQHRALRTRRRPKHRPVRAFRSDPTESVTLLSTDAVPVDQAYEPHKIVVPHHVASIQPKLPLTHPPSRWADYIASLPSWETTLLNQVTFVDKAALLQALRHDSHLYLASDGGEGPPECDGKRDISAVGHF